MGYRWRLFFFPFLTLFASAFSDLVITKADRHIDLSYHIIRVSSTIKVENKGPTNALEFLLAIPDFRNKHLAYLSASSNEGKRRSKGSVVSLHVVNVQPEAMAPNLTFYFVSFPNELKQGELFNLEVLSVFTHLLEPFPEEISQADDQLVLFQDSAVYLSPYEVLAQSLTLKLPSQRVESYTKLQNSKLVDSKIRYGPYDQTELEVEPRFPIFGGWKTSFTIGYSLPLQGFLFVSEGKRFLNFSFGCPFDEVVIDNLTVKGALPEGSREISVSIPFSTKEWEEADEIFSFGYYWKASGCVQKDNIVPEHNQPFQVYYIFNSLSLLHEPLMLIDEIFALFLACIIYMHSDLSISKSNASYLARLQSEEMIVNVLVSKERGAR